MKKNRGNKILGSINDTEAFATDDLGNRVGQVTQRDGVGNAHRNAASRHGILRPDITATNRIHLGVNDVKNSVDELTNRYTAIDANSLAYDDAGSLTQDKDGYRTTYDYENRPVRIAKLDGQTEVTVATFAYDALGRRIRKVDAIANNTSLYYYSDNWQVLAEYDGSGVLQASYAYGNYIDEVLLMRRGGVDYFYLHDHLYSPAALLSSSGAVVERYEYDVYGTCHIQAPDFSSRTASLYGNAFLFQGHMQDSLDSGSLKPYDFRYRAYDSFAGRWMQQDPHGVNPADSISNNFQIDNQYKDGLSLYLSFHLSPAKVIDPYGLWGLSEHIKISLSAAEGLDCGCCTNRLVFKLGLARGSIFPDVPIRPHLTGATPISLIIDGVMIYRSHEGDLSWWHGMARKDSDNPKEIQQLIIDRVVDAADRAQSSMLCNSQGFILGEVLHTVQDTYARSHTYRDGGAIKQFQYYRAQDGKKHATGDTADNVLQYDEAVKASRTLLDMILCDKASSEDVRKKLINGILQLAPSPIAGGTLPEYE